MRYTYTDKKMEFSPEMKILNDRVVSRLKPRDTREGTFTGPAFDGRTPFLDVFADEKNRASFPEKLAQAIVKSWVESDAFIDKDEIIVGITRPCRRFYEHFSFGIEDYEWLVEDDPLYKSMKDSVDERYGRVKVHMAPGSFAYLDSRTREILGKERASSLRGLWWAGGYQGHTVPGYPKLLSWGFDRTIKEIDRYMANTGDSEKLDFYKAQKIIVEGLSAFAEKYSSFARELAARADDPAEKKRLTMIADNCMSVAHNRPQTLYEAVQLAWFYLLWDWVDCVGRADQYFYPFYEKSDDSPIPREDIIVSYMLKIRENGVHNLTIGGIKPENGENAANELTFLMLQTARTFHDVYPRISVRVDKSTPNELLDLVVTMWSEGMSDPTVVSDTLVVPGFEKIGVITEDARDYTMLGCQELEIPGKSNFGCEDGSFNLAKVLEYTIHNGRAKDTGVLMGLETGEMTDMKSVEDVYNAFEAQIKYLLRDYTNLCSIGQTLRDKNLAKLVKSVYTDDCMVRGVNQDAGGATYNYGCIETAGLAVVADSFAALEKLVFEEKKITMEELMKAIDAEYAGYEDIREMLLGAPKFGNDDELPDKWAVRVLTMFWEEIGKYISVRGGKYLGSCSLLEAGISYGNSTAALPDGHRRGDPLGNTMGPRPGADVSGLTAMFKSVSKLPLELGLGGTTLNTLIPREFTDDGEKRQKIAALVRTFLENGGQMAQITTASKEDMIAAQKDPEHYADLIVRVGGFSTFFVQLGVETQNELISRYS